DDVSAGDVPAALTRDEQARLKRVDERGERHDAAFWPLPPSMTRRRASRTSCMSWPHGESPMLVCSIFVGASSPRISARSLAAGTLPARALRSIASTTSEKCAEYALRQSAVTAWMSG